MVPFWTKPNWPYIYLLNCQDVAYSIYSYVPQRGKWVHFYPSGMRDIYRSLDTLPAANLKDYRTLTPKLHGTYAPQLCTA